MSLLKGALILALAPLVGAGTEPKREDLVVHEWGTFTSVAGEDGAELLWAPLWGPGDLPCFVDRLAPRNIKLSLGLVRMETPVLYFYSPLALTLSVRVDFPQGWITEWYPKATKVKPEMQLNPQLVTNLEQGQITWDSVQLLPGENPEFPSSKGASHYYAARETDSAPIRIGNQQEKLIFYRGMGNFSVPLQPRFDADGKLEIRKIGSNSVPLAILFENREGSIGYRFVRNIERSVRLDPPELRGDVDDLRRKIAEELVEFGLYRKEALAMVETWRDSWFEEGMRVFYLAPRAIVDSVLPLRITPPPVHTARVFVGRIEVLSPWGQRRIATALASGDVPTLVKFGRFLGPFADIVQQQDKSVHPATAEESLHRAAWKLHQQFNPASCVQ